MKSPLLLLSLMLFAFNLSIVAQDIQLAPTISKPSGKDNPVPIKLKGKGELLSSAISLKSGTAGFLNLEWCRNMSTSYGDRLYDTAIDNQGNVIVVGATGYSDSDTDAIIFKLDKDGNVLWADEPATSSKIDEIYGVAVDKVNNIYITGMYNSSAFDETLTSKGGSDIFVAKYSTDGILLWAKSAGGIYDDYGSSLALDEAGNVYVVGFFEGQATWGTISKTSSDNGDLFIAKYDKDGNSKWVRTGDAGNNGYLCGIGVDKVGQVYVGFNFSESIQFEGSSRVTALGDTDMFLVKYDASGSFKWLITSGGVGHDGANDTSVDADGNVFVTGYFSGLAQFGQSRLTSHGSFDIFAAKFSPGGNLLWVNQFGGTGSQTGWGINTDEKSNCYVTGWFSGTGAFDNTTILSTGGADAYLIKYDKNGNLIWVSATATGSDEQVCNAVAIKNDVIAITGRYKGTMNIFNTSISNSGGTDAYVAKLKQFDSDLPAVFVNPGLNLSSVQVKQGQSIMVNGNQFSPIGKVDLYFSGPGTINPITNIPVDVSGKFSRSVLITNNLTAGNYKVTATDKISGKSVSRNFEVILQQIEDKNLRITQPSISIARYTGDPITIAWEDKVIFD